MSITNYLPYTTTRIECWDATNNVSKEGTGFFFGFLRDNDESSIPTLVTNKHVIEGTEWVKFHLCITNDGETPISGGHVPIIIKNSKQTWIPHPDSSTDIAILPLSSIHDYINVKHNKKVFLKSLSCSLILSNNELKEISVIEDILMVGYPNGLWDEKNNIPIIRRGITATPSYLDFNDKKEFLIDCSCFPGSSGSPVFLYETSVCTNEDGIIGLIDRVKLLGVFYAVYQNRITGKIDTGPLPIKNEPILVSSIPNNLGLCIKAEKLLCFENYFSSLSEDQMKHSVRFIKLIEKDGISIDALEFAPDNYCPI